MPFHCFSSQRNEMLTLEYKYFYKDDWKNFQLPMLCGYCNKKHLASHPYLYMITKLVDSHKDAYERNRILSNRSAIRCSYLLHHHATNRFISETERVFPSVRSFRAGGSKV